MSPGAMFVPQLKGRVDKVLMRRSTVARSRVSGSTRCVSGGHIMLGPCAVAQTFMFASWIEPELCIALSRVFYLPVNTAVGAVQSLWPMQTLW